MKKVSVCKLGDLSDSCDSRDSCEYLNIQLKNFNWPSQNMFALKCAIPYRLQEALLSEEAAVTWVRNWGEEGSDAQRESKYGHAHLPKLQKWRFVAVFRKRAPSAANCGLSK